jgi:hypothetical protein
MKAIVKARKTQLEITLDEGLKITGPDGLDTAPFVEYLQTRYQTTYSPALGHPLGFYAQELAALLDGKVASVELGEEPEGMIY